MAERFSSGSLAFQWRACLDVEHPEVGGRIVLSQSQELELTSELINCHAAVTVRVLVRSLGVPSPRAVNEAVCRTR
jgi:hypothetical protein